MEIAGLLIAAGGLYLAYLMSSYQKDWAKLVKATTAGAERTHRRKTKRVRKEATHKRSTSASKKAPETVGF